MNVLMIGDVVGKSGCDFLMKHLTSVKRFYSCDICIVNGENSAPGNGITKDSLEMILSSGADAVTTGNHVYKRDNFYQCLESERYPVARPANYPERAPGRGYIILDKGRYKAAVINMMGTSMMQPLDNPFDVSDRIIQKLKDVKFKIMDFHAEATGEKKAITYYLDGKVSVIAGTHTHVQTADEQILPNGTGYITDLGMTGPENSVLGVTPQDVIKTLKYHVPVRFSNPPGSCFMCGCVFTLDDNTGKCLKTERITVR